MTEQNQESFLPPSKRAARRILQRAFVLTGRDRALRQHIREARFTTVWILEDWDLVWTVIIDRGRVDFERRPARHPDLTLTWPAAADFFSSASLSSPPRGKHREGISHGAGFQSEIPRQARNDRENSRDDRESGGDEKEKGGDDRCRAEQGSAQRGGNDREGGKDDGKSGEHHFEGAGKDGGSTRNDSGSALSEGLLKLEGKPELRRAAGHLLNCFFGFLGHVLRNPVDGAGESLL
jgi:hypothetical protein